MIEHMVGPRYKRDPGADYGIQRSFWTHQSTEKAFGFDDYLASKDTAM